MDLVILSEIKRKVFHLLGLIYVAALYFFPRGLFLSLLAGFLVVEIAFEVSRLNIQAFNSWLHEKFGELFREEEKGQLSGVIWMALGVLSTALLIEPVVPAITTLLFLIFGDSAASLVGKRVGGVRWPNTKKTLAGSAACFIACFVVGMICLWPDYSWVGILLTALAVALFEVGYIPLNDNFLIPLTASIAMWIFFGLKPYVLKLF